MNNKVKILFLDVDGTLTDGKIYMGANGELMKAFNIKDGAGIHDILIPYGIIPVIITGRKSDIVTRRCAELGITEIYQEVHNKVEVLKDILKQKQLCCSWSAYIGDDINDLACMRFVKEGGGIIGCPSDAVKQVLEISDFISSKTGGNGAVREFVEFLVS